MMRRRTVISLTLQISYAFLLLPAHARIIYVKADAAGDDNGTSWTHAYRQLQPALDEAAAHDQIWFAAGSCFPTIEVGGSLPRYQSFQLKNTVALYGGFAAIETSLNQRNITANSTLLDGNNDGSAVADMGAYELGFGANKVSVLKHFRVKSSLALCELEPGLESNPTGIEL